MHTLVLMRHGESTWNLENRFTGWADVGLTPKGIAQAQAAGQQLKEAGLAFDLAYTSVLKRATHTLWHCLDAMDTTWLPVQHSWRLNERHYGALQGLNKTEVAQQYGDAQVLLWRRSYNVPPPSLERSDARHQPQDPRYHPPYTTDGVVPLTECLKDTVARVLPLWTESMAPQLRSGKRVLVVAHGNSLRALVKHLEAISDDDIVQLNIPNGTPWVYSLDAQLKPICRCSLGNE